MAHSNSSINCFLNCEKKYELSYISKLTPEGPISPHLKFGEMAHKVLYDAGVLRDDRRDGIDDYNVCIPSESIGNDLKQYFGISNWNKYFKAVIKQCYEYEKELCKQYVTYEILRETICQYKYKDFLLKGILDLLILDNLNKKATIIDYKFSSNRKTQEDFDNNSQLQLYAYFVNKTYGIPIKNIQIGYIDIPKQSFDNPTVLSNGTLSRAKSQNVSAELYKQAVMAIHGEDKTYNCEPGGHYYDCYCALQLNKAAYLNTRYVDKDTCSSIMNDLLDTVDEIEFKIKNKRPFLRKCDSYSCKNCEYKKACKEWLTI